MTYHLDDRVGRLEQNVNLWRGILRPDQRRPMSVPMRAAVIRNAKSRKKGAA